MSTIKSLQSLSGFTPKKTVSSVLTAFTTAIKDLDEVSQREVAEAERQQSIANKAIQARLDALDESNRADEVRKKIEALISN